MGHWFWNVLTYGWDKLIEVAEGEKGLGKLSKKQLERSSDDVNILPLTILQVQFLCGHTAHAPLITAQQGAVLSTT